TQVAMGLNFGAEKIRAAENFPLEGWAPCAGKSIASQNATCIAPSPAPHRVTLRPLTSANKTVGDAAHSLMARTHRVVWRRTRARHTKARKLSARRTRNCFSPSNKKRYGPEGNGTIDLPGNSATPDWRVHCIEKVG